MISNSIWFTTPSDSFLPKDWKYRCRQARVFQNLALFTFNTLGNSIDDFSILNLITRQKFWMRKAIIASESIKKAGRLDLNYRSTSFRRMRNEIGRVIIAFRIVRNSIMDWTTWKLSECSSCLELEWDSYLSILKS